MAKKLNKKNRKQCIESAKGILFEFTNKQHALYEDFFGVLVANVANVTGLSPAKVEKLVGREH